MENLKTEWKGQTLRVTLSGHVDSSNAGALEQEVFAALKEGSPSQVIVDCDALEYISSAGLRMILRIKKTVADTQLENVVPDVYEIFDMTGFTEMMDIRKAYRVLSVEGCEVIGRGANGEVYRIDRDTIVKVYLNPDSLEEIQRERELARTAFVLGVPTAIPYDVVRIQSGGYGSVFELLDAKSFAQLLKAGEMSVDEVARISAELLRTLHGTYVKPESMPDMRAVALDWVEYLEGYLPAEQYRKLHDLIEAVPPSNQLLHGDFHIKNVMVQNGEALLIDMDTLCHGHPVFELGSMYNAYCGFNELHPEGVLAFLGVPYEQTAELWDKTVRLYLSGADEETIQAVKEKAMIIGCTRMMRRHLRHGGLNDPVARRDIENCARHFAELLPKTDTLLF